MNKSIFEKHSIRQLRRSKKGFTLVELMVVMAVVAVLVLLAAPRFIGKTEEARHAKHIQNVRVLEEAAEKYYMDNKDWPRLHDDAYTAEDVDAFSERVFVATGKEVELNPNSNYYDIDYDALESYVNIPEEDEDMYIFANPIGKFYYLEGADKEENKIAKEDRGPLIRGMIVDVYDYEEDQQPSLGFTSFKTSGTYYPNKAAKDRQVTLSMRSSEDVMPSPYVTIWVYDTNEKAIASESFWLSKYTYRRMNFFSGDIRKVKVTGTSYSTGESVIIQTGPRPTNYNLTAESTTDSITFNWENMDSATFYDEDGSMLARSTGQTWTIAGLNPGTIYTYEILFIKNGVGQRITFQIKTKTF